MNDAINQFLFGWYPYLCIAVFLFGSLVRFDREQYTWRSGSSQLLRRKQLTWGSNLFHFGILIIFIGHFVGLLTPIAVFNFLGISHGFKQMMAIVVGGIAGIACFIGLTLLVHRRLFDARIRNNSSFGDIAVLLLLYVQLTLGLATIPISLQYLDGSEMLKFMAWAQGIVTLQPGVASLVADANPIFKLHLFLGMTIFLVFPFTRLVHIWSAPVWYLGRRGYQVVRTRQPLGPYGGMGPSRAPAATIRRGACSGGVNAVACAGQTRDGLPKRVPVSVNGVSIPHDAIARETQYHPASKPIAAWQAAARALVVRELLLQEAQRLGIAAIPRSDTSGRHETEEEALIRGLMEQEIATPEPDETTCRRYYEQNLEPLPVGAHLRGGTHSVPRPEGSSRRLCRGGTRRERRALRAKATSRTVRRSGAGALSVPVGCARWQSRPDHGGADDLGVRAGACRARPRLDRPVAR